jgi:hypothetical protein
MLAKQFDLDLILNAARSPIIIIKMDVAMGGRRCAAQARQTLQHVRRHD